MRSGPRRGSSGYIFFIPRLLVTAAVLLHAVPVLQAGPAHAGASPAANRGNHLDSPVYYELYDAPFLPHDLNLKHLPDGKLVLRHFPSVDVGGFDWYNGGLKDFSWWIQVEELRFLLPFIRSDRAEDRALVKDWIESWYRAEQNNQRVNGARWGESISVAYRGMVMVFCLKTEETREDPDLELTGLLRNLIYEHQQFLSREASFTRTSNHGLVESAGLLELTRVFPDSTLEHLGLDRMLDIVERSVSETGVHMEHSPLYHFVFLDWLENFAEYLHGLSFLDEKKVGRLSGYRARMLDAAWYLVDHRGLISQVGDSDSVMVGDRYPQLDPGSGDGRKNVLYDEKAGYAVYKGNRDRGDKRYVLFANQNRRPKLISHYHDDVLSVYFSYDGETILGDSGKYEYSSTAERRYFFSPAAHSTVFPLEFVYKRRHKNALFVADQTGYRENGRGVAFSARMVHTTGNVSRTVTVPRHGGAIEIDDRIAWPPGRSPRERQKSEGKELRPSAQVWNIGPDVIMVSSVETGDPLRYEWLLTSKNGQLFRLRLEISGEAAETGHKVEMYEGNEDPILGWYSPAMFVKRPSPSILVTLRPERVLNVRTTITPVKKPSYMRRVITRGY
jgi:hypothetical protein